MGNPARTLDLARSDVELLEQVRGGDRNAYVVLYERHVEGRAPARPLAAAQPGRRRRRRLGGLRLGARRHPTAARAPRRLRAPTCWLRCATSAIAPASAGVTPVPRWPILDVRGARGGDRAPIRPPRRERRSRSSKRCSRCRRRSVRSCGGPRSKASLTSRSPMTPAPTPQAVAAQAMRARRALGGATSADHLVADRGRGYAPAPRAPTPASISPTWSGTRSTLVAAGRWTSTSPKCAACSDAKDELERVNQHLRTRLGLPLAVGVGVLRVGLEDRVVGWLAASSAPLVAASGLVVVSAVVPLVIVHRRPWRRPGSGGGRARRAGRRRRLRRRTVGPPRR